MSTRATNRRRAEAGFSLIEVLAVIVILSILMVVLLPRLSGMGDLAKERMTKSFLEAIGGALSEYEDRFGDYPPSTFLEKWGPEPNATNRGGETLVLSLWSPEWGGTSLSEDKFVNTDGDETRKSLAKFPKASLYELSDEFGNPIAYFHHRDYGRQDTYLSIDSETGAMEETVVKAAMNPATKTYANPNTYQLISAGSDGRFGTEDDVFNFKND